MKIKSSPNQKAWIIAADMGLGHQRAAYPLKDLGGDQIITAGSPAYASRRECKLWAKMRYIYEGISRVNHVPIIGGFLFGLMDRFQEINPYYPFRDLSTPTIQVKYLKHLIKKGLGETLVELLAPTNLPIVTTFFAVAIAAESRGYPDVYLLVTDTDINRVWVPDKPSECKIKYLAPCGHAIKRLKEYGISDEQIYLTGFPLPKENLGSPDLEILKLDLAQRLNLLDPKGRFWAIHRVEVEHYLLPENCSKRSNRCLSLTFAVGGAGAQKEIGAKIIKSLRNKIKSREIRLNLVAGLRTDVEQYFKNALREYELEEEIGLGVNIIYSSNREKYFHRFNALLRTTDILWTKPSELSFYSALGIPIIIAPPLGAHEHWNRKWLLEHRAGFVQDNPEHCAEWLFDLLNDGLLAQAAWDGFLNGRKCGTFKIEELLTTGTIIRDFSPLKR